MNFDELNTLLESDNDKQFLKRVYQNGISQYKSRLKAINYQGMDKVLDAGCGFGQWSFALAEMNSNVYSFDYETSRVNVCNKINNSNFKYDNLIFTQGSLEIIDYPDNYFDAVFCYGVIFITNYIKSLKEIYRVLKPGGKIYFTANDIGWYLYNLENDHNSTSDFSSRQMAKKCLIDSIKYYALNEYIPGTKVIMPVQKVLDIMKEIGYINIKWDGDGKLNITEEIDVKIFFKKEYYNEIGVYEVLGDKK